MNLDELNELSSLDFDDEDEKEEHSQIEENVKSTIENPLKPDESEVDDDGRLIFEDTKTEPDEVEDEDLVTSILKSRGIDPNAIQIEDEGGNINTVKFSELDREEQLDILNSQDEVEPSEDSDYDLDDDEVDLINAIREAKISPREYLENYKNQILQEYNQNQAELTIDSLSDEELFLADLKSKIPDITDEEAEQALTLEQSNSDLFTKKVAAMRTSYKEMEARELEAKTAEEERQKSEKQAEFENQIINAIQDVSTGIDLGNSTTLSWTTDDMNEVASYILDEDSTGTRYLARALNDPKTLVEMVWFALKGKEAISQISDYYKAQIKEAGKTNYNKGYEDAQKGNKKNEVKTIVRKPSKSRTRDTYSIEDLDY